MINNKVLIGITHGDFNGVSYEIIANTFADNRILDICVPIIYGSSKAMAYHRKAMNLPNINLYSILNPKEAKASRINIIDCLKEGDIRVEIGKSTALSGESSFRAIERATNDIKSGFLDAIVTMPINKNNIQSKDFNFPGHTEYFAKKFNADNVLMLMTSNILRVAVLTGHIAINHLNLHINFDNILNKIRILNKSLINDFCIEKPKIAVLGLNPHSGDGGVIGTEESDFIIPAIKKARDENIFAFGPYPADGFFGSDSQSKFDAVLAMYHDQGLAPFKAMVFDEGVNFTAGLPIVRTSPDHGTGYNIAGKAVSSTISFRNAIYTAIDVFKNRNRFKNIDEKENLKEKREK